MHCRIETLEQVEKAAEMLDQLCKDVCKARVAGATAGITGGILGIVGIAISLASLGLLAPVGVPLAISGGVLGAAGGVTSAVPKIVEMVKTSKEMKAANTTFEKDKELFDGIIQQATELAERLYDIDIPEGTELELEEMVTLIVFTKEVEDRYKTLRDSKLDSSLKISPEKIVREFLQDVERVAADAFKTIIISVVVPYITDVVKMMKDKSPKSDLLQNVSSTWQNAEKGIRAGLFVASMGTGIAKMSTEGIETAASATKTAVRVGVSTTSTVLGGVMIGIGGIGLIFDVVDLVSASVTLAQDGKADGSKKLLEVAKKIREEIADFEKLIADISAVPKKKNTN
jgi:hypothetical protein